MSVNSIFMILIATFLSLTSHAGCLIKNSQETETSRKDDTLYKILMSSPICPQNVNELKSLITSSGLSASAAMVANRGRMNPTFGSFSFFESVSGTSKEYGTINGGSFFFGHFTAEDHGSLVLDQSSDDRKLMIELIIWDEQKGYYNFYELIGKGDASQWYYRGDSADILKDNENLHRQPKNGQTQFGNRLRCSGCHTSGGPIMKEIEFPYNDWQTSKRNLLFAPNKPTADVQTLIDSSIDAEEFSKLVRAGISKLDESESMNKVKKEKTLQELLRPIFATLEINLHSDTTPLSESNIIVKIPSQFWLNPVLGNFDFEIKKEKYLDLLKRSNSRFPETNGIDADHGWLTPVKGLSDITSIQNLISSNLVDLKFVWDIMMIDFQNPLFSEKREALLKYIPLQFSSDWRQLFIENLKAVKKESVNLSEWDAIQEALIHLTSSKSSLLTYKEEIKEWATHQRSVLQSEVGLKAAYNRLLDVRSGVLKSQISKNPRGQILEPGFRVIFPDSNKLDATTFVDGMCSAQF